MGVVSRTNEQPLRNHTTPSQERVVYEQLRSLCQGDEPEYGHPLRKGGMETLSHVYGLWGYDLSSLSHFIWEVGDKKKANTHTFTGEHQREARASKVRKGVAIMCITSDTLVALLNRYGTEREIAEIFRLPYPVQVAEPYRSTRKEGRRQIAA